MVTRIEQLHRIAQATTGIPVGKPSVELDVYRMCDAQLADDFRPVIDRWNEGLLTCQELLSELVEIARQPAI